MPLNFLQRRPTYEHLGDKVERLRTVTLLGPWLFLLLSAAEFILLGGGKIPPWLFGVLIFVANPLIVVALSRLIPHIANLFAHEFIETLLAAHGGPRKNEFSLVDSMIVRGRFDDAANELNSYLVAYPDDVEATIRLATLTADHLGDDTAAVELLLKARSLDINRSEAARIGNGLIDLYRTLGNEQALEEELGRFSRG